MLVEYEELYDAYIDCRKRKRSSANCQKFEIDATHKLWQLWKDLNNGTYKIGRSIAFIVHHPKDREVFAADFRDRIVHHLIVRRIEKLLEEEFIEDSYSCRKGKGTLYGIKRCEEFMRKKIAHSELMQPILEFADFDTEYTKIIKTKKEDENKNEIAGLFLPISDDRHGRPVRRAHGQLRNAQARCQ